MSAPFEAIVVGGGINGLVTTAYLARGGVRVILLEQAKAVGGGASTIEFHPGFHVSAGEHDAGLFRPQIAAELELEEHGLVHLQSRVAATCLADRETALTVWKDASKTLLEIERFSLKDADKYPEFIAEMGRYASIIEELMVQTPPDIFGMGTSNLDLMRLGWQWKGTGLDVFNLGPKRMMQLLRVLPMTAKELLDEWFESKPLRGLLGSYAVRGGRHGPQAAGTAFNLLYNLVGAGILDDGESRFIRGGLGSLAQALRSSAEAHGARVRTDARVAHIQVKDDQVRGVALASGEEIRSSVVVSALDPQQTFLGLVGSSNLEPRFVRRVRNYRLRGATAKMHLALDGLPSFEMFPDDETQISGHVVVSPDLTTVERASDAVKYGRWAENPVLDIVIPSILDRSLCPLNTHVMSIAMQFAPYELRGADWNDQREALGDKILATISEYAPEVEDRVLARQVLTPKDAERLWGRTGGDPSHGEPTLDQLFVLRPFPGFARYRGPIAGLYMCGASNHPGGVVNGASGLNAAREILKDLD